MLSNIDKINSNELEIKGNWLIGLPKGKTKGEKSEGSKACAGDLSLCAIKIHFMFSLINVTFDEDSLATATLVSE